MCAFPRPEQALNCSTSPFYTHLPFLHTPDSTQTHDTAASTRLVEEHRDRSLWGPVLDQCSQESRGAPSRVHPTDSNVKPSLPPASCSHTGTGTACSHLTRAISTSTVHGHGNSVQPHSGPSCEPSQPHQHTGTGPACSHLGPWCTLEVARSTENPRGGWVHGEPSRLLGPRCTLVHGVPSRSRSTVYPRGGSVRGVPSKWLGPGPTG